MDIVEMAQLDAIQDQLKEAVDLLNGLKNQVSLAINDHGHLKVEVQRLEGQVTQLSNEVLSLQRDRSRFDLIQKDIDNLGNGIRDMQRALPAEIQNALTAALQPYQHALVRHGVIWRMVKSVGAGGWAIILLLIGIILTRVFDRDPVPQSGIIPSLAAPAEAPARPKP